MIKFSPTAKIFLYVLLIISVFLSASIKVDLLLLILVFVFAFRIPLSVFKKGIIPITVFLIFTFLSNILFHPGRVMYEIFGFYLTEEGLIKGWHLTLRLFILILGAKVLTYTTTAEELIGAITSILGPIGKWKSVREFIFTMSLTLRLLPIVYEEAQILYRDAVASSSKVTFSDKIKLSVLILTPLFERCMKRVSDLARCDKS